MRKLTRLVGLFESDNNIDPNHVRFSTYFKLFVAMGLTWGLEVVAWFLSDKDRPAPKALIMALNVTNIFQGIVIFVVFTMKHEVAKKMMRCFSSCFGGKTRAGGAVKKGIHGPNSSSFHSGSAKVLKQPA